MSSMRNAVQRRNHKERAQPLERSKWGLLEKKKDYSLRAKDHNEKKKKLRALRQKAAERNPDEFAFGMMSSTSKNGVKITQRAAENGNSGSLDLDYARLLKTQDEGYLRTVLQQTKSEIEKEAKHLVLLERGVDIAIQEGDVGRRKTFDEDGNEIAALASFEDMDDDFDSSDDTPNDSEQGLSKDKIKARRKRLRMIEALEGRLQALRARESKLSQALRQVGEQRAKMHGTIGGSNKDGVKFKVRERKR